MVCGGVQLLRAFILCPDTRRQCVIATTVKVYFGPAMAAMNALRPNQEPPRNAPISPEEDVYYFIQLTVVALLLRSRAM